MIKFTLNQIQSLIQATNPDLKSTTPSKLISEFKKISTSSYNFSFYISNRDANNGIVNSDLMNYHFEEIKTTIIDFFGGVSIQELKGFYKNTAGKIIAEHISILTFHNFNSSLEFKKVKHILALFFDYGIKTNQECLMLTYNNSTTLVYL